MGKSRRRDRIRDRSNPIAKIVKHPTDPELAAIRDKQILPIISDLTSPESKKRSSAAVAIANIIEDKRCRKLLLREQIVHILLEQTITDTALESKSAGWGVLRNLALEEEADFCIHLYRQDILTAIQGIALNILDTIESKVQPIMKLPKANQSLVWTLCSSVIGLISSLAGAQDEILDTLSQIPIFSSFAFSLLGFESLPDDLFVEVLNCLAALTEDNETLAQKIVDHPTWLQGLIQLRELGGIKAVAACGVLHNIFSSMQWFDHNTPIDGNSDAILVITLIQSIDEAQKKQGIANGSSHSSPDQILQLALEITASIATCLQEALEHAGRSEKEFEGFSDDAEVLDEARVENDGSENDGEERGVNEEMNEEEIDADMELVARTEIEDRDGASVKQPTLEALIRIATPTVLAVARDTSLETVRTSALSVLNNISWTVSSIDINVNPSSLSQIWAGHAQLIWTEIISPVLASNTADLELASSITSMAWALARSVPDKLRLGEEEHRKFMALYQASKRLTSTTDDLKKGTTEKFEADNGDAFQGLGVKCIGVLGRLALRPAPILLNREIGVFLITILSALPETPAADAVEALNQLFDIYADRTYSYDDAVFWGDGFYQHLEAIVSKLRKIAKSIDRRKYTELRLRADEAVINLGRFLTYKRKEKTST